MTASGCDRCDSPGGVVTYANQVAMPIRRRVEGIDWCIHWLVAALNAANIPTVASCCGHGTRPGVINLEDGRALMVFDTTEDWERAELILYGRAVSSCNSRRSSGPDAASDA